MSDTQIVFLSEAQLATATPEERAAYKKYLIKKAIMGDDPPSWLRAMFPRNIKSEFGEHHLEMWNWVWGIELGVKPPPFAAIWNRGGAKSSSAEMAVVALGAREKRRYVLYCCETQDQSDEHVNSIATLLGTEEFALAYPGMADRAVDKYGQAKGWRRDRLSTASGFVVDGIGLSDSVRGLRSDDQRPDLIIIDDVDGEEDSIKTTNKKIRMLTRKLLPTGSPDLAVLAVQNMVHSKSIFARLASKGEPGEVEPADFLMGRVLSGPVPAVWDLEWEFHEGIPTIMGGTPSWGGLDLDSCQDQIMEWGISSFLVEAQHMEEELLGGMFDDLPFEDFTISEEQAEAESGGFRATCCWMDPAVTETDRSDSCAIQIDSLGRNGKIYRRYSWEKISGPDAAMKQAILKAVEYGADVVGVETDQGGLAWKSIFNSQMEELEKSGALQKAANASDFLTRFDDRTGDKLFKMPLFREEKAGASKMSKTDRASRMLSDYERDKIRHIEGTHRTLQRSLMRFPRFKPFDLVDACLVAGTMVMTLDGEKPIESVLIGEMVWTRSGWRAVTNSGPTRFEAEVVEVTTESGHKIIATPDHRVWTSERGWVPCSDLAGLTVTIGSWNLPLMSNTMDALIGATHVVTVRPLNDVASVVYDLEVEGAHEFFANGVLVHNCYWSWDYLHKKSITKIKLRGSAGSQVATTPVIDAG